MSLKERFKLEDLENEGLGAKRTFPFKGDEAQIATAVSTSCEDEDVCEKLKS